MSAQDVESVRHVPPARIHGPVKWWRCERCQRIVDGDIPERGGEGFLGRCSPTSPLGYDGSTTDPRAGEEFLGRTGPPSLHGYDGTEAER